MAGSKEMNNSTGDSETAMDANLAKKKILLVDDVKLFIELEKSFFQRKKSFEILTAENGREALEIVASKRPDLIFMDLHMPKMNGDECCRMIRDSKNGKEIPVIMVTSAGRGEDRARCLEAGCDEIITKPVNRTHFLSIAKKYLEVHERDEQRFASHIKVRYGLRMDNLLTDYTVNLNTGGLYLSSSDLFPVNTQLNVEFSLPESDRSLRCRARVAWINNTVNPLKRDLPAGMGMQFVDLAREGVDTIRSYINRNELSAAW